MRRPRSDGEKIREEVERFILIWIAFSLGGRA
jgi:hypothetical protein